MASAMKNVNKISQIVRLKQVMQRWKNMSLKRGSNGFDSGQVGGRRARPTPSGWLAVYVGHDQCRFVIPTRFLNLPAFVSLLNQAEEEFGFQSNGGLVLPCEIEFFKSLLVFLERDEQRYGGLGLDEFFRLFSEMGFDSCKDTANVYSHVFTPLLQKAS